MLNRRSLLTISFILVSQAGWTKSTPAPGQEAPVVAPQIATPALPPVSPAEMSALYSQAGELFYTLEDLITNNDAAGAAIAADSLLKQIKRKMGINPVIKDIQEPVYVSNVIPQGKTSYAQLTYQQKKTVRLAVGKFMGGTYVELLLLYKRIRVLHSAAVVVSRNADSNGKFLGVDRNYVINALAEAYRAQIEIVDATRPNDQPLVAFDSDILDPDYSFESDRDVLVQAMRICQLSLSEDDFLAIVDISMAARVGIPYEMSEPEPSFATGIGSANFDKCHRLVVASQYKDSSNALQICLSESYLDYQFIDNPEFDKCHELASKSIYVDSYEAIGKCTQFL